MTNKMDETTKEAKKEADQEMELDIDIARAYCELTEGKYIYIKKKSYCVNIYFVLPQKQFVYSLM